MCPWAECMEKAPGRLNVEMVLPKVVTYVPKNPSSPRCVSNLTKTLSFFWGTSCSLSLFERDFHVKCLGKNFLVGKGWRQAGGTKLLRRRGEKHCPEAGLSPWLPICSALVFVSPCTNRLNTWIMPSSGLKYTYITYPFLPNQPDTFLCW